MKILSDCLLTSIVFFEKIKYFFHHVRYFTEFWQNVNTDLWRLNYLLGVVSRIMFNEDYLFERFIVMEFEKLRRQHPDYQEQVKPGMPERLPGAVLSGKKTSSPQNKWRRLTGKGYKPQRLNFEDFLKLARFFGKDPMPFLYSLDYAFKSKK